MAISSSSSTCDYAHGRSFVFFRFEKQFSIEIFFAKEKKELCQISVNFYWTFLSLEFVILFGCIAGLLYEIKKKHGNMTRLIKGLLPIVPLCRVVNYLLVGRYYYFQGGQYSSNQTVLQIFTGGLPGYLLISILSLLVILWGLLYTSSRKQTSDIILKMRNMAILGNSVMYAIYVLLIFLMLLLPHHRKIFHTIEALYAALLSILSCLSFFYFGRSLKNQLMVHAIVSAVSQSFSQKVGMLSWFCGVTFFIKSVFLFLDVFLLKGVVQQAISGFFYVLICETLPVIVVESVLSFQLQYKSKGSHFEELSTGYNFQEPSFSEMFDPESERIQSTRLVSYDRESVEYSSTLN